MKYHLLFSLICIFTFLSGCSKDEDPPSNPGDPSNCFELEPYTAQLPNFNFEKWGSPPASGEKYKEPCGGVWTSGNGGSALLGKQVCQIEMNADGTRAVKMVSYKNPDGLFAAGSLFTGEFILDISNPINSAHIGVPFNLKPKSFEGLYKYTPVNNDSALIAVFLTKYNPTTKKRDTVGKGEFTEYGTISSYSNFSILLDYSFAAGGQTPDTIGVSCTSSKGARTAAQLGESGSTLILDNCKFVY